MEMSSTTAPTMRAFTQESATTVIGSTGSPRVLGGRFAKSRCKVVCKRIAVASLRGNTRKLSWARRSSASSWGTMRSSMSMASLDPVAKMAFRRVSAITATGILRSEALSEAESAALRA